MSSAPDPSRLLSPQSTRALTRATGEDRHQKRWQNAKEHLLTALQKQQDNSAEMPQETKQHRSDVTLCKDVLKAEIQENYTSGIVVKSERKRVKGLKATINPDQR